MPATGLPETLGRLEQRRAARGDFAFWATVVLITVAGLALRTAGARGDLWLDEIWTIELLGHIDSFDQIFWGINHDNNHYLNSAYLYLVGLDSPPLLARGLSIALGCATVAAAAAFNASRGRAPALVTALLFAISYPMVNYGSEARGYAGLVLFTILALLFLERRLKTGKHGVAFGLSILLGVLSHLTMLGTVAVAVLWVAWLRWQRSGKLTKVSAEILPIFSPALAFFLPFALCVALGRFFNGFIIGGVVPFSVPNFAAGFAGMIRNLFGIPVWIGPWPLIAIACAVVAVAAHRAHTSRGSLYLIGIVGLPAALFAARLPNLEIERYFLVPGTLMLLLAGDLLGMALAAGGLRRFVAGVLLAAFAVGSALSLSQFFQYGRGSYSPVIAMMGANGPATYGTGADYRLKRVVEIFAERNGVVLTHVTPENWCGRRPAWILMDALNEPAKVKPTHPEELHPGCALHYRRILETRHWGLSGADWTLYRRLD
jgi:hypothetical protein